MKTKKPTLDIGLVNQQINNSQDKEDSNTQQTSSPDTQNPLAQYSQEQLNWLVEQVRADYQSNLKGYGKKLAYARLSLKKKCYYDMLKDNGSLELLQ